MSNFSQDIDEFVNDVNSMFRPMFALQPDVKSAVPSDKYTDEDGSLVIEMAVVGKTKDDIKISSRTEDGRTHLKIEAGHKPTDAEKDVTAKRHYWGTRKIKQGYLMEEMTISNDLDLTKLTAKVSNGLLTVRIPAKEEVKPQERVFEIQ